MQEKSLFAQKKVAVALSIVLLMLVQQVCAGPLLSQVQPGSNHDAADLRALHTPRRMARMTPLWRVMNSKPFGAYCQNNYECSTGLCREGHCAASNHSPSKPVKS